MTAHGEEQTEPGREAAAAAGRTSAPATRMRATLRGLVTDVCGIPAEDLDEHRPLAEYGLTSRDAVALTGHLEQLLGRPLPATLLWENPTIDRLADALATPHEPGTGAKATTPDDPRPAATPAGPGGDACAAPCAIAVIGIGCRLPGTIDGPDTFWKRLLAGTDVVGRVPGRRWRDFAAGPGGAALVERTTRWGAFLDDIEAFDADHFGITPREAEVMDPQQRLLLEVACEALDHAGTPAHMLQGSDTGVFVGLSSLEYGHLTTADPARLTPWTSTGAAGSIAANRLSYLFDLHGPSMTIDTACSSSLVAVHQACRSLRGGECDTALAAGVNILLSPAVTASFQQAGALAADGRCKPFDAAADGITRGEGCGVVVLKRLADAQRDGDRVLAVIRGTAVNSDGRSAGLMAPNPDAQASLLRSALGDAQAEAADIDYVETHGTGTLLGDPIEAGALGAVLGSGRPAEQPLLIGSVKSNLGHLEGAAGIVGLIKTVLALHHGRIPPSLHFREPNPHIDFTGLRLRVVTRPTPWPDRDHGPARAGVSAFGFGGTNAHAILEQAPTPSPGTPAPRQPAHGRDGDADIPHVLVVSARNRDRVADVAAGLARWIAAEDAPALPDIAHTLARHRRGPVCAAVVARTHQEATDRLAALARGEEAPGLVAPCTDNPAARAAGTHRPVLVFSGYGSQWQGMGQHLLRHEPLFAAAVDELDPVYTAQTGISLRDMLARTGPATGVDHTQPLLFGMQLALARALRAYGVRPAAVIGHSMGEVGAAVVAGALDDAEGLRVILHRSTELAAIDAQRAGAMAAVELPETERADVLARFPGVEVAVHSSPRRCTVAGPAAAVRHLVDELTEQGILARLLDVGAAGHSPAVDPVVPRLRELLATLRPRTPEAAWYSTVLDDPRAGVHADAEYWGANVRRPVRFRQAVAAAAADGHDLFLEIAPHPVALVPLAETLQVAASTSEAVVIPTLRRNGDEAVDLRAAVARLHLAGVPVDERKLWPGGRRTPLPTPAWRHQRHWVSRRGPAVHAAGTGHPLLGLRTDDPRTGAVLWQADLGTDRTRFSGRGPHDRPVLTLPASAALMIAAAKDIHPHDDIGCLRIEDLTVHQWLPLAGSTPVTLVWEPTAAGATVTINARGADGTWRCHASARLHTGPEPDDDPRATPPARVTEWTPTEPEEPSPQPPDDEELLTAMLYAPAGTSAAEPGSDTVHSARDAAEIVPTAVRSLQLHGLTVDDAPHRIECFPSPRDDDPAPGEAAQGSAAGDGTGHHWDIVARAVRTRITARGVELRPTERRDVPQPLQAFTYDIQWQKSPLPVPRPLDRVLLLTDEPDSGADGLRAAVSTALQAKNVQVTAASGTTDTDQVLDDWLRDAAQDTPGAVVLLLTRPAASPEDDRALRAAARLARRLAAGRPGQPVPRLRLVTVRAQATAPGEPGDPAAACLRGLVRVLALEQPALRAGLVDIDTQPDSADDLAQELLGDSADDEVAWRAGTRLVARLARADLTGQQYEAPFVRPDGAYVITGGLTGLGLATARRLAERGAGRLVLNGRRPPGPEARTVLAQVQAAHGTSITVVQGDIADPDVAPRLVQAALDEGHRLRGVVHCAGVLHDRIITDLESSDIDTVLRPKVLGALHLEAATATQHLDWWVSYSSAAALLGSPGQAAYAAANAWLDALAHRRRAEGPPAASIAWGPWSDVGAAPAHPALALDPITPPEGLDALQALVVHNRAHTGVVHLDAQRVLEAYPGLSDVPFFADVLREAASQADDWPGPAGVEAFGDAAAEKVYERLVKRTAGIMGFRVRDLDDAVPLTHLGLDSLMTVRIRNAARQDFAVDIPANLMLRGATLRQVGDTVLETLGLHRGTTDTAASRNPSEAGLPPAAGRRPGPALPNSILPRDAAERLVAGVWAEVLGHRPADVRADFVADGGDQRAAEAFVDAVRGRLGDAEPALTAEAVLSERTVSAIAELIRPVVNPTGESVVNVLRPPRAGSRRLPLFTFHPAGGPTSVYLPLTRLLPSDQAVYGMERLDAVASMEDKAAHYVTLIRDIQPQGPYRLLGWSFGGCLAYEAACQLKENGQGVAFLGLIDTILPAALPDLDSQDLLLERFGRFAEYIEKTYGHRLDLPWDELAATPDDRQIDVIMRLVAEAGLDMSPGIMEHQRTSYVDARIGERYVPRPYDGRVVLYRAQQAQPLTTALDPRYLRSEADLGWAPLCPSLEIVPVEGDHLSLIDPPHVTTIARHLARALRPHAPGPGAADDRTPPRPG
ncbi:type I polyketide synthase [Streptomyces sp. S.PNR 29]|uniref:type I polyketide synthase n=1 Tax=Streptomyces sp. S.PNR 29 TaxID=2973805 RepID=UPI0025AFD6B3|nr:type I polyketide synthase [Streptomyces sp. S.PNR 29]MDN0196799.1 SDR family NAD(P)-dependent oxidoreductase [Streptomyces sp. S.PNR 29]